MIGIKMFPARNGDALLVTINHEERHFAMLVDGGYATTFDQYIRAELRRLSDGGRRLDLVVATHVDADHITGLLTFFRNNGNNATPAIISVNEVWHNSLRALTGHVVEQTPLSRADEEILAEIGNQGLPTPTDSAQSEISARQGSLLAASLLSGGYRWNGADGTRTIQDQGDSPIAMDQNIKITIVGPNAARLDGLRSWWISKLRRTGFAGAITSGGTFDDAFEALAARGDYSASQSSQLISQSVAGSRSLADAYFPDDSAINGSSIAFILEHQTRRLLLLGDAWAEDIATSLRTLHSDGKPLIFDAIKVAHHGSLRNTSTELLELIDSPIFLISTNGDIHGHPDIEVLKAIVDRPATYTRTLHFNYSTPASRFIRSYSSRSGTAFSVLEGSNDWIYLTNPGQL
jgi:Metallo-beta-lactamase superfamily